MYNLIASPDQQAIIDTVSAFLSDTLPVERHRADRGKLNRNEFELWPALADIGGFGISAAEARGGAGMTLVEEVLAFREYGRALLSPCGLASVLAARAFAHIGAAEKAAALLGGQKRAALALAAPKLDAAPDAYLLFDADHADYVAVWIDAGFALYDKNAIEIDRRQRGIDGAVTLDFTTIGRAAPHDWLPASALPLPQWGSLLSAAMLVGIAEAVRDMAVAYAKMREQFGRPIGAFQAIKHRCADMAVRAEAAWAQTLVAALRLHGGDADAAFHVAAAKLVAGQAALTGAQDNIQIHGAIGFTAECNAHLYLKRAHLLGQIGGTLAHEKSRIMAVKQVELG